MATSKTASAKANSHLKSSMRFVGDQRFGNQLNQVRGLKQFLFEEKVRFNPNELGSIDLGPLNNLRYWRFGRQPTAVEWQLLDKKLSALTSYLDDDLRRKARIRELSIFFGLIPLTFLLLAVVSIVFYALYPLIIKDSNSFAFNVAFLLSLTVWTISQGGLGACAFLGTRVAIQKAQGITESKLLRESADITDVSVLRIRIIQGLLFGFLIGLPVSFPGLNRIWKSIFENDYNVSAADFALILMPFILGFSTNLVLVILDRSVLAIQTFFGLPHPRH